MSIQEIEKSPVTVKPENKIIEAKYIKCSDNSVNKLVNNSDQTFKYEMKRKEYRFILEEPFFINKLRVIAEGNSDAIELKIEHAYLNKLDYIYGKKDENPSIKTFEINKFCKAFRLKGGFFATDLKLIEIYGYSITDLKDLGEKVNEAEEHIKKANELIEEEKISLEELNNKHTVEVNKFKEYTDGLKETISSNEKRKEELVSEINQLDKEAERKNSEITNLQGAIEQKESLINELNEKHITLTSNIEQSNIELRKLNQSIVEQKNKLKELDSDVSLFTDELSSYAHETTKNARFYGLLCFLSWFLIAYVTYRLFNGSLSLVDFHQLNPNINVWDVLIIRIPFAIICVFIIETAFQFSLVFFKRIIEIHKDRLKLSKLSILARDVSDASTKDLDLTDEETYQGRLALKMQLIKAHLANEIDKNFEFEVSNKEGIARKLLNLLQGVKKKEEPTN